MTGNFGLNLRQGPWQENLFYVLNVSYELTDQSGTFLEMYGDVNAFSSNFDTGYYFLVKDDLQLDMGVGWQGNNGESNWFADVGFSWRINLAR